MSARRFRYPLEALLKKKRSDWKTVKVEEVTASRVVDNRRADVDQARDGIDEVEQLLRHARRDGTGIDVVQQHLLGNYLTYQRSVLVRRQQALQQAREVHGRIRSNLDGVARGIKSLEKHRVGREAEHRTAQRQLEQKNLDELWLLGRRKKGETD